MAEQIRKNAAILEHMDRVAKDIEHTFRIADPHERETHLKSVLFYWLGVLYDEGAHEVVNLEMALKATREMLTKLKKEKSNKT